MIWVEAEPNRTFIVTGVPADQKVPEVSAIAPLMTTEASAPGARVPVSVSVSGAPAGPSAQTIPLPPETRLQVAELQEGRAVPEFVPAKATWQVDAVQEMVLPPLFLIETVTAAGAALAEAPAFREAPTTATLELAVALLTRLYTEALTTPPTPRTAAMMIKRSML